MGRCGTKAHPDRAVDDERRPHVGGAAPDRDEIDPRIGDRVYRIRSSENLRELGLVLRWAREVGLLRVVQGLSLIHI